MENAKCKHNKNISVKGYIFDMRILGIFRLPNGTDGPETRIFLLNIQKKYESHRVIQKALITMNHAWRHCRHKLRRTRYAYECYRRIDRASRATLKIEIVTRSNIAIVARSSRKCLSPSLFHRASWDPREFAKFPTQLQLQLCGLKTGSGARSRRVHLRIAQSYPQTTIRNLLQASSSSSSSPYAWHPCRYRSTSCWMRRCACNATSTWTKSYCTPWSGTRTATNFIAIRPETRPWC